MMITIKYFGRLAEITGCAEEHMAFSKATVSDILDALFLKYPALKHANFQVAQDLKIVSKDTLVMATEIALLPPFSGG